MIRVYVAGAYSAYNVIDVLKNIGKGQQKCARLFALGFAPFCPWHDKSFITDNPHGKFDVEMFYRYSLEWLKVSDCVLVLPGYEQSSGTLKEIEFAENHEIPVFYNEGDLIRFSLEVSK